MNQSYEDDDLGVMRGLLPVHKSDEVPRGLHVHLIKGTANMSECFHEGMINTDILQLCALNTRVNWIESVLYGFWWSGFIYLKILQWHVLKQSKRAIFGGSLRCWNDKLLLKKAETFKFRANQEP